MNLPKNTTTFEEWNEHTREEQNLFIDTVIDFYNIKENKRIKSHVVFDMVRDRFSWGQYKDESVGRLIADLIKMHETVSD